jgi:hypothetical protein
LVSSPANDAFPVFSPDGRWVAYASDEAGTLDVYVRPFDAGGARWQVSTGGAAWPAWSAKTSELVYATISGSIMAVKYEANADTFRFGRPEPWSAHTVSFRSPASPFTLHPDGTRMVASSIAGRPDAQSRSFVVVTGFFDELAGAAKAR